MVIQDKTAMKVGVDGVLVGAATNFNNPQSILDVGAGTGLLSFFAAQRTKARITAIEIEENAYKQCCENVRLNKLTDRIQVLHTSFQDYYKKSTEQYDAIISNPPFFDNAMKSGDSRRNIARHSLFLPKEDLIKGVAVLLKKEGIFSLILPYSAANDFDALCHNENLFCCRKLIIKPKENKPPNRIILEYSFIRQNLITESLALRENDTNEYTAAYKKITKKYYLHF